jgi:profilin
MSWQGYVDNLMATKHMTACGIFGLDGVQWGASTGYPLTTDNVKSVIAGIADSSKLQNGLNVGADRYILVRADPGVSIILKKGANGVVAYKSTQSIIVAVHDDKTKAEIVLTDIGRVIDYLSRHGY